MYHAGNGGKTPPRTHPNRTDGFLAYRPPDSPHYATYFRSGVIVHLPASSTKIPNSNSTWTSRICSLHAQRNKMNKSLEGLARKSLISLQVGFDVSQVSNGRQLFGFYSGFLAPKLVVQVEALGPWSSSVSPNRVTRTNLETNPTAVDLSITSKIWAKGQCLAPSLLLSRQTGERSMEARHFLSCTPKYGGGRCKFRTTSTLGGVQVMGYFSNSWRDSHRQWTWHRAAPHSTALVEQTISPNGIYCCLFRWNGRTQHTERDLIGAAEA